MGAELTPRLAAARRSPAPGDDLRPDAARAEGHLDDRPPAPACDLRRPWHDVADQGHTASCVGWAVADSVVRWHLVEAGRLSPAEHLSARHIWMAAKERDQRDQYPSSFLEEDGTSLKVGLDVARKFGVVTVDVLPWQGRLAAGSPDDFRAAAAARQVRRYFNLGDSFTVQPDRSPCFDDWRRWMHQRGPVLVLIAMDAQFGHPSGMLSGFDPQTAQKVHSAALFGYGPDHFLVRSSWGTAWGEQGYARMDLDYAAQAVVESYGVVI